MCLSCGCSSLDLNIFRLALLAVTSCVSVQLLNVVLLSLPLFLGRQLCRVIGFPVHHDIYNILVGVYMIWGASLILARWNAIVSQLPALVGGACKYCVLGLLWLVVIPSVLGTLFHLTFVVPLTVPLNVTPIFFIYQVSLVSRCLDSCSREQKEQRSLAEWSHLTRWQCVLTGSHFFVL